MILGGNLKILKKNLYYIKKYMKSFMIMQVKLINIIHFQYLKIQIIINYNIIILLKKI